MILPDPYPATDTVPSQPWPRHVLSQDAWSDFLAARAEPPLTLLALWADTAQAHVMLIDKAALAVQVISTTVEAGRYPAVSPHRPTAAPFERMVADLWGHAAEGAVERRPWLDQGHWPHAHPMAVRSEPPKPPDGLATMAETSDGTMLLARGPIHGNLDEAARLRLHVRDGVITAAEAQLGFTHKGALILLRGKSPRNAARFAARLSGDATVAHAVAFATATEAAVGVPATPRAVGLRAVMLEIERIAGHLDILAEVARRAGADVVYTRCGTLREQLARAAAAAFGHRLMMDCVVPGGVAVDITAGGETALRRALGEIATELPALRRLHAHGNLTSRLLGVGAARLPLLRRCGTGGPAARAAGCSFDARMLAQETPFTAVSGTRGDALGRQQQRIEEIAASLEMIATSLRGLSGGPLTVSLPQESGEGIGCAESARGDVWHWLRLDHGQIAACFPRDAGWGLWPAAEAALVGSPAEDADLIRASFSLPASGMDL